MKQLTCEMCGGIELLKQDGVYVCQHCGTKYSVEEAKKMMVEGTVQIDHFNEIESLLARVFMFLEDGDWKSANEYCEKVLDIDPQNAQAYLGKLMAELNVSTRDALRDCQAPFDDNTNYQKILRFGDESLKQKLIEYNEQLHIEAAYNQANYLMKTAVNVADYQKAAHCFETIPGYMDADEQLAICQQKIETLKSNAKKQKKIAQIIIPAFCAVITFVILLSTVIIPNAKYNKAKKLMSAGDYEGALSLLNELDDYKDSEEVLSECRYQYAILLTDSREYAKAIPLFESLGHYKDSIGRLVSVLIANGEYEQAREIIELNRVSEVTIPDGVTTIEAGAFETTPLSDFNCSSITHIIIPDSVITIGEHAFHGCKGLTSIVIPDSVTTIEAQAFYGCDSLAKIVIPKSVTTIGELAFGECDSLINIVLSDGLKEIGARAFRNCDLLNNITIPNSVTYIGEGAFEDSGLRSITISDSVTQICEDLFYDCGNLKSVTLPNSITSIGKAAFADCYFLSSITIPDSVTSIGGWAFQNCEHLTSITIPDSVTDIGECAFLHCKALTTINYMGSWAQWGQITRGTNWNKDTKFVIRCAG